MAQEREISPLLYAASHMIDALRIYPATAPIPEPFAQGAFLYTLYVVDKELFWKVIDRFEMEARLSALRAHVSGKFRDIWLDKGFVSFCTRHAKTIIAWGAAKS